MYIAFKWLISMAFVLWLALCFVDIIQRKPKLFHNIDKPLESYVSPQKKNMSLIQKQNLKCYNNILPSINTNNNFYLQFFTFFAIVCMVFIFKRKNDIISFTRRKLTFNISFLQIFLKNFKKITATFVGSATITKLLQVFMLFFYKYKDMISGFFKISQSNINVILLNKLKYLIYEHRNLGQMLMSENKNIRMQYRLEALTKRGFSLNIDSQQVKEIRDSFINFQHLYQVLHQENNDLKSRLRNVTQEKEDAERNLIKLINEVYRTKNNNLKAYCSRFIVKTTNNLLNGDVKAEVEKFKQQARKSCKTNKVERHNNLLITPEISSEKKMISLVDSTSNLKGPPEIYVWMVKDKNGIIEKLYECDNGIADGDTVKKIRQYSVYYDTESLVDLSDYMNLGADVPRSRNLSNLRSCVPRQKFLTNSREFRNFLENNIGIVMKRSHKPTTSTGLS